MIGDIIIWRDSNTNEILNYYILSKKSDKIKFSTINDDFLPSIAIASNNIETDQNINNSNTNTNTNINELIVRNIAYTDWDRVRLAKKWLQSKILPKFTQNGIITKYKISDKLFSHLRTFWFENNGNNSQLFNTKEQRTGPTFNQFDAPLLMLQLTQELEKEIWHELETYVSDWTKIGINQLQVTSIYGIRKYTKGAIVQPHLDTCHSHIFGAILNIDQASQDCHWPLQIVDNFGTVHEIIMQPQDIVLYEATTCIHARPFPLNCDYYANAFIHFNPKGWRCPL